MSNLVQIYLMFLIYLYVLPSLKITNYSPTLADLFYHFLIKVEFLNMSPYKLVIAPSKLLNELSFRSTSAKSYESSFLAINEENRK